MRTLGYVTTIIMAAAAAALGLLAVKSLPDVRRYLKWRKMCSRLTGTGLT